MRALATFVFLLMIGALAAVVAIPDKFEIERAVSIDVAPKRVFPLISDLRQFAKWSPWEGPDAEMIRSYSDPAKGEGASYEWTHHAGVTSGRIKITSTQSPSKVRMKLDLERKFEMQNVEVKSVAPLDVSSSAELVIVERGGATVVTWNLRGKYSLVDKLKSFAGMLNNDIGDELDLGLARLKKLAES